LGVGNLLANFTHLELLDDFDLTLLDLGGDLQGMEEGNLGRVHTGRAGRDGHIDGRGGANLSSSLHLVSLDQGLQVEHGLVGEDETHLALDLVLEDIKLRDGFAEFSKLSVELVVLRQILGPGLQDSLD
jgi:hypothetical protein